jgi:hypothetical protein
MRKKQREREREKGKGREWDREIKMYYKRNPQRERDPQ